MELGRDSCRVPALQARSTRAFRGESPNPSTRGFPRVNLGLALFQFQVLESNRYPQLAVFNEKGWGRAR
jgi:hypothetical protein